MARRGKRNNDNTETETSTVTTSEAPQFTFEVLPAEEGYQPDRRSPGRKREPSFFDEVLPQVKDQGWQRVPFSTDEEKQRILRELNRAKQYTGLGLEKNETETAVEFRVRDRQTRSRNGSAALAEDGDDPDDRNE